MCKTRLNIRFIIQMLGILLPILLLTGIGLATNTNTSTPYPFHVCHAVGSGNVNCTAGDISSGYYNFTVVNASSWNVTLPFLKLYPLEDSWTSALPYEDCLTNPYVCRNSSQWNFTYIDVGVYSRSSSEWAWLKFTSNKTMTGITYCENAYLCLNKTSDAGLSSGAYFSVYYSHNQTWSEKNLTWDTHPDWIDAIVDTLNITETDGFYCWDVSSAYCGSIENNATYMIRTKISSWSTGTRYENFTVGSTGMSTRAWDLYVDENNKTISFNTTEVNRLLNATGKEERSYIRVVPNYTDFVGSKVNNATLKVYVPTSCNQSVKVDVYECREQNMTANMTWNAQPYCTRIGDGYDSTTPGWKSVNITNLVQRAALTGGYQSTNISLMLAVNSTLDRVSTSVTKFNTSTTSVQNNYTSLGNHTFYVNIPKYANVTSAFVNITGLQTWSENWNYTAPTPSVYHVMVVYGSTAGSTVTKTCSDTEAGAEFTHGVQNPSVAGGFLWNMTPFNNTNLYNWTMVYANWTAKGGVSGGGGSVGAYYGYGNNCGLLADACEGITSFWSTCSASGAEESAVAPASYDEVTLTETNPTEGGNIAIYAQGSTAAGSSVNAYSLWETGSFLKVQIQNFTSPYPQGVAMDVGSVNGWDWGKQTANLTASNRTNDLTAQIMSFLSTCTIDSNGFCQVPFTVHVDTAGTVRLQNLEVNYTMDACFASSEYTGTDYDPRIEIGYTYDTKQAYATFASNNDSSITSRPYLLSNYTWSLNASSMLNMTNKTNNVIWNFKPNGQTNEQWEFKVCSNPDTGGPVDMYVSLVNITNATGNSMTSLPKCVQSFYHYSNSTSVFQASAVNVTGNTAGRVLYNLQNGTCGYIWQNITLNNCTSGDSWEFDFEWEAKTDS